MASAAGLVAVAIGFALLPLLRYETLMDHLDPLAVDRDAAITPEELDEIVLRFRILAAALVALALALLVLGRRIDPAATAIARAWYRSLRRAPRLLCEWVGAEHPAYLAAFAAILVTAVMLRIAFLDVTLRYDEATTYNNFVSKPLYVGLAHYPLPNNHLLHTFLAKVSVTVLGDVPWAIRLPALLAGLALVPATLALARILYGRAAALLAAALVASSSTFVEYSTNARGYTLVALFTVVALIAATRVLDGGSIGAWAVIAVAGALGLHTVPVMLYPLGGVFVWLLLSRLVARDPLRPLLARLAACGVATAALTFLLYAPVLAASGVRSVTSNDFVTPRSWSSFLDRLPRHAQDTLGTWVRDLPLAVSVVLGIGLVASVALAPRLSRFPVPMLLAILVWTLPVLLLQRVIPFTRVWLFLVPLASVTAAGVYGRLLERAPRRTALVPAVAVLVAIGAAWAVLGADSVRDSRETGALLDAPSVAAYLAERVEPGDRVFATGSDTILEYYLRREGIDPRPLIYTANPRARTFLVVNVLGGQILEHYLPELDPSLGPPQLVRRYPSALVYVVEPRA